MSTRHHLLEDALFSVHSDDHGLEQLTLPGVLAGLTGDRIVTFAALQAHQEHPWHAFLVQLAGLALERGKAASPPGSEAGWRKLLEPLAERSEAWCLRVDDPAKPAFMQPPSPSGDGRSYSDVGPWPDSLDVLQTAKNHDVKARRMRDAEPEHWVYALVSLQTMQGYSGRGNYGIARMNGGFSSRPSVGLVQDLRPGRRFVRDLEVLRDRRAEALQTFPYRGDGLALLWTLPWDGATSLALKELDPFFIEVCRRVRLVEGTDGLRATFAPTDAPRVEAKDLKGALGDPWTPVKRKGAAALTITEAGFHYKLAQELLLGGDFEPGAALKPRGGEGDMIFRAVGLARGQGTTGGYHVREVPVPKKVLPLLGRPDARDRLGVRARARVEVAGEVRFRVLGAAVRQLGDGGTADREMQAFDQDVDRIFFEKLWEDLELEDDAAAAAWQRFLVELARERLGEAIERTPMPAARRYRDIAAAERVFWGSARKQCPLAFEAPAEAEPNRIEQEET